MGGWKEKRGRGEGGEGRKRGGGDGGGRGGGVGGRTGGRNGRRGSGMRMKRRSWEGG